MIELEIIDKVNELGEGLNKIIPNTNIDAKLSIQGPNNWLGHRYYKCGISKNGDEIWMQFISEDINLYFDSALKMADDKALIFEEILSELNFTKRIKIENDKGTPELITFFLDQIQNVTKCFDIYEKRTNC